MRKISIFTTLVLISILTGCGSTSDSNDNNESNLSVIQDQNPNNTLLTPPAWIQGTWMDRSEPLIPTGWLFTTDDLYTIVGENSVSLMETGVVSGDTIDQDIEEGRYSFTIHHHQTNSTETFTFNRLSDTEINYENSFSGTTGPFIKE